MKKKILVINPISLFPTVIMAQRRTLNKIECLARDHIVDVATFCHSDEEIELSYKGLKKTCRNFFPVQPVNPKSNIWKRKYFGLKYALLYYLAGIPREYSYYGNKQSLRKFKEIIAKGDFDIVQIDYWYQGKLLEQLNNHIFKAIDTHYLVRENRILHRNKSYHTKISCFKSRELKKSEKLERRFFDTADLIIPNSRNGKRILDEIYPSDKSILIPNGQDIDYFRNYVSNPGENTILFYGSMGSKQNVTAFYRLWNHILPLVKKQVPEVKLIVVGANPPDTIRQLHDGERVVVTGFVEDIREYLGQAAVMVIPLEIGSGFRGRVVEVMAMGIPVVGTHNALDSIEIESGVHGYIDDRNEKMADGIIRLLIDPKLREQMSAQSRKFASERYSLEATFGKLSAYFAGISMDSG